ncbi:hypothetical protein OIN60_07450 [Paenibacillus sp. P96]|uniref:Anti-sigma factor n=1 Tax=Paenibacillus zeirhizosphaerae TaxID=2987519 RepID=A0ABT9FPE7_9BACL|nr:hypothetical protein [Paenibacillus sp. P96]MDP4096602.1 hypothetical protein [Paenibacillus sp. P96]
MNSSNGIPAQDIRAYLRGDCSAEQADYIEKLLLEDEAFFLEYMKELEQLQATLPRLDNPTSFADRVMASLPVGTETLAAAKQVKQRWYEHTFFHYALAASITLLILFTGTFDKLATEHQLLLDDSSAPSYSDEAMKAAIGWLDGLKR